MPTHTHELARTVFWCDLTNVMEKMRKRHTNPAAERSLGETDSVKNSRPSAGNCSRLAPFWEMLVGFGGDPACCRSLQPAVFWTLLERRISADLRHKTQRPPERRLPVPSLLL